MSMSTDVFGIRPPNDKWREMKKIYDSCVKLKEDVPEFVWKYFNGATPEPDGVVVELSGCAKEWSDDDRQGIEVEVAKLPKDVTIIRFYNSW